MKHQDPEPGGLRRPDAKTNCDVIGCTIYLVATAVVVPLTGASLLTLVLIVGLYVFHRHPVKRNNARAFPPDSAPPASTSAA